MYNLTLENEDNKQLVFNQVGGPYTITDISGLSPADATINTNTTALLDGGTFNSSKVNMRQILLNFVIEEEAESNRLEVYNVIRPKKSISVYYQSELTDVFINGYVESVNVGHFEAKQSVTVSILCPFPYWKNAQEVIDELQAVINMFYFPFGSEGGKNLLQNTANTTRTSGITFTVNSDGSVTANGTATSNAYLVIGSVNLNAGVTYALNGCPSGGGNSTYRLYWQGVSGNYDEGEGTTYTPQSDTTINIRMVVYSGATVDNLTFYPMVRYSTYEDDSYQSYGYGEIVFGEIDPTTNIVVDNNGTVDCGLIFELYAMSTITNPKIYNYITQDFIGLNFTMQAGDLITINTGPGEKGVTLLRNGEETNIFNSLMKDITWLQLPSSGAVFVYTIDDGLIANLNVKIKHYDMYEGV